jgi:hypothetical protein
MDDAIAAHHAVTALVHRYAHAADTSRSTTGRPALGTTPSARSCAAPATPPRRRRACGIT